MPQCTSHGDTVFLFTGTLVTLLFLSRSCAKPSNSVKKVFWPDFNLWPCKNAPIVSTLVNFPCCHKTCSQQHYKPVAMQQRTIYSLFASQLHPSLSRVHMTKHCCVFTYKILWQSYSAKMPLVMGRHSLPPILDLHSLWGAVSACGYSTDLCWLCSAGQGCSILSPRECVCTCVWGFWNWCKYLFPFPAALPVPRHRWMYLAFQR